MVLRKKGENFSICFFGQFREANLGFNPLNGITLDFKVNERFLVVLVKNTQEKLDLLEVHFLNVEDFTENHHPQNLKFAKLAFPETFDQILSYSISNKTAYFVSQNHELFEVDLNKSGENIKITKSEAFKQKKVAKVFSGQGRNFAVEIKEKKAFEEFTTEEVVRAAKKTGLDDYLNILKYSKVTGKDLVNCSDEYLKRNFGLKNHTLIQVLRAEMKKYEKSAIETILLFWGDNSNKQFKFANNKEKFLLKPEIIQIPASKEEVEDIVAFHDITYLIGSRGSIWATIPQDCSTVFKKRNKGIWMDVWTKNGNNGQR